MTMFLSFMGMPIKRILTLINDDVSRADVNNRLDSLLHKESIAANEQSCRNN